METLMRPTDHDLDSVIVWLIISAVVFGLGAGIAFLIEAL